MTDKQNQIEIEDENEINLLDLLHVLARRKMVAIWLVAAAVLLSTGYSLTLPNIYSATARVLPPAKEAAGGLGGMLGQLGGIAALATGGVGGTGDLYLGIAKSRTVGDAVLKRLDLVKRYRASSLDEARKLLDDAVKVQAAKDTIITITVDDKDPKLAALIANTVVDELGKTLIRLNFSKAGTERLFLEKRLDLVKSDLKNAEEGLKGFAQQNKVVQVDAQAKSVIEGVAKLRAELASREVQLSVLRTYQTDEGAEVKTTQAVIAKLKGELSRFAGSASEYGLPGIGNVPGLGLEYGRKMRELKTQEAIYEQLMKQYEVAKLNEAKDSSSLQVLDEAVAPSKKTRPKRSQIVILSVATTLLVALFIIFTQEHYANMSLEEKGKIRSILRSFFSR